MRDGLILDFAGVLTNSTEECFLGFCQRESLPHEALLDVLANNVSVRRLRVGLETGRIGQRRFEDGLARGLGVAAEGLMSRILEDLRPNATMLEIVRRARDSGLRTACLSNSWGRAPYDPYAAWPLEECFDEVVFSHETGLRKPDPESYRLACRRIDLPPARCVLVDDTRANLPGAADIGLATVLFQNSAQAVLELRSLLGPLAPLSPLQPAAGGVRQ
ncbi:HAD family hydrolase [Streptomyces sp. URMC 123]|uniref:HAD family hydrolase n=1 Tax=Streptomyces sp. URMC 123 TaxID=3423403 RepID=UPI003F1C6F75